MSARTAVGALCVVVALVVGVAVWSDGGGAGDASVVGARDVVVGAAPRAVPAAPRVDADVDRPVGTSVDAPAPLRLGLDVVVRHPDGAPAAHALVAVTRSARLLASGTASREGRLRLLEPPAVGPITVWVAGVTYGVHRETIAFLDRDEVVVQLPDGAEVSGVVRVDGAPPRGDVPIGASSSQRGGVLPAVDEVLRREVVGFGAPLVVRASPTVDGAFRITGIPRGVSTRLTYPGVFRLADGRRHFTLSPPARDVVVDLVSVPLVTARLVDEAGAPVRGARAECAIFTGERWDHAYATSGDDGRVAFALPNDAGVADTITIGARSPSGSARGLATFEDMSTGAVRDLGDVVLSGGRGVHLLVLDDDGEPVRGAVARPIPDDVDPATTRHATTPLADWIGVSRPTGANGRTHAAPLLPGESRLEVVALGHAAVEVDVPPPTDDALIVTLPRAARLDVFFDGEVGLRDLELYVTSSADLCSGGSSPGPLRVALGAATPMRSSFFSSGSAHAGLNLYEATAQFPAAWRVIVDDVAPGRRIEVSARLPSGEVLWGPDEVELQPGEWRTLEIVLGERPRTLYGRVVDEYGEPVVGAEVAVLGRTATTDDRTDASGQFALRGLRRSRVDLSITGADFVPTRVARDVDVGATEIVVERGVTVDVHVVDREGRDVVDAEVWVKSPERGLVGRAEAPRRGAHQRFEHLPATTLEFAVRVGARRWTQWHQTAAGDVEFVLDEVGVLQLEWPVDTSARGLMLRIDDEASGDVHVVRPFEYDERRDREAQVWLPLGRQRLRVTRRVPDAPHEDVVAPHVVDVVPGVTRVRLELPRD